MNIFLILQILFDAVLLFGILFLFHYSVHQREKKTEEADILKNMQVQEIKENLQDLLLTLKQLGKEVSDDIHEQVLEAEQKTEIFRKTIQKLQKDLNKTLVLAEEVNNERQRLEDKLDVIQKSKKKGTPKSNYFPQEDESLGEPEDGVLKAPGHIMGKKRLKIDRPLEGAVGFSSGVVREVYRMADEELAVNEIAQKTQLSRAEVQLILNLRGNRFSTPN